MTTDDESVPRVKLTEVARALANPLKALSLLIAWVAQNLGSNSPRVAITGLSAIAVLVGLRVIGLDGLFWLPSFDVLPQTILNLPIVSNASGLRDIRNIQKCVVRARQQGQAYALLSIGDFHQVENTSDNAPRTINERVYYLLLPLKDIDPKKDKGFDEEFATEGRYVDWGGPFNEDDGFISKRAKYFLHVHANRGEPIAVVTGVNKAFDLPFKPRKARNNRLSLTADQDFEYYPAQSDVICNYTAVFDSETLLLSSDRPEHRDAGDGFMEFLDVYAQSKPEMFKNSSFAVEVSGLNPQEGVMIVYTATPRGKTP